MILTPESIQGSNTLALERIWVERLQSLPIGTLSINFDTEQDSLKLTMWLEQFGVPREFLPAEMNDFRLRELLKKAIKMYRLGGTVDGIKALAEALGASDVTVHTGAYESSLTRNDFSVSLLVYIPDREKYASFRDTFEKLFKVFSPISLWANDIKVRNTIFNHNFNSKFF